MVIKGGLPDLCSNQDWQSFYDLSLSDEEYQARREQKSR
jgi:hypothetical protein